MGRPHGPRTVVKEGFVLYENYYKGELHGIWEEKSDDGSIFERNYWKGDKHGLERVIEVDGTVSH